MSGFCTDVRETLFPAPGGRHGPLPPLLVGLTVVTGLVDAFSYLVLGHVFVANMTGNVVFLGFALVGAPGFSIAASIAALLAFWLGALVGGKMGAALGQHRGRLLSTAASLQAAFVVVAVILAGVSGSPVAAPGFAYPLIVSLTLAMGLQNAAVRKLAVPDLTTTVLTMTLTGIAADSTVAGGQGSSTGRQRRLRDVHVGRCACGGRVRPPRGHRSPWPRPWWLWWPWRPGPVLLGRGDAEWKVRP